MPKRWQPSWLGSRRQPPTCARQPSGGGWPRQSGWRSWSTGSGGKRRCRWVKKGRRVACAQCAGKGQQANTMLRQLHLSSAGSTAAAQPAVLAWLSAMFALPCVNIANAQSEPVVPPSPAQAKLEEERRAAVAAREAARAHAKAVAQQREAERQQQATQLRDRVNARLKQAAERRWVHTPRAPTV